MYVAFFLARRCGALSRQFLDDGCGGLRPEAINAAKFSARASKTHRVGSIRRGEAAAVILSLLCFKFHCGRLENGAVLVAARRRINRPASSWKYYLRNGENIVCEAHHHQMAWPWRRGGVTAMSMANGNANK